MSVKMSVMVKMTLCARHYSDGVYGCTLRANDAPVVQDTLLEQDAHDSSRRGLSDPSVCAEEGESEDDGLEQQGKPRRRGCDDAGAAGGCEQTFAEALCVHQ